MMHYIKLYLKKYVEGYVTCMEKFTYGLWEARFATGL